MRYRPLDNGQRDPGLPYRDVGLTHLCVQRDALATGSRVRRRPAVGVSPISASASYTDERFSRSLVFAETSREAHQRFGADLLIRGCREMFGTAASAALILPRENSSVSASVNCSARCSPGAAEPPDSTETEAE